MAKVNQAITVKHQSNLGEDVDEVAFGEGDEVTHLKEWSDHYLCKNDSGQLFNLPKASIDA